MYERLRNYCKQVIPFTESELGLLDKYFEVKTIKRKEFLLRDDSVCDFIAFIADGTIRHFHIKDGVERTCDISTEDSWVTDFQSFNDRTVARMNLQAMEPTTLFVVRRQGLASLYSDNSKFETFGRIMVERVVQRATDIAMSLSSNKPEERFQNLLESKPDLFQRVPQKYIANLLGISPESLSRIQKRILGKRKS